MHRARPVIHATVAVLVCSNVAAEPVDIWFDTSDRGGQRTITPYAQAHAGQAVTFQLSFAHKGAANQSRSRQQGRVVLSAVRPTPLARLTVPIPNAGEKQVIELRIWDGPVMLAQRKLALPAGRDQ